MRFLFSLLLSLALSVNALAAASAQTRVCCASEKCSVEQCIDIGCLPAVNPLASQSSVALLTLTGSRPLPIEAFSYLPNRYNEVWTPPD